MGWISCTRNETHPIPLQLSEGRRAPFKTQTSKCSWGLGAVTMLGNHIFPRGEWWDHPHHWWDDETSPWGEDETRPDSVLSPPLPSVVWVEAWGPLIACNPTLPHLSLGRPSKGSQEGGRHTGTHRTPQWSSCPAGWHSQLIPALWWCSSLQK